MVFLFVLPRLPGYTVRQRPWLLAIGFAIVQSILASLVFAVIEGSIFYISLWAAIGGGAKDVPAFLGFGLSLVAVIVWLLTAGLISLVAALSDGKLQVDRLSASFVGSFVVLCVPLPILLLSNGLTHDILLFISGHQAGLEELDRDLVFIDRSGHDVSPPPDKSAFNRRIHISNPPNENDNAQDYEDEGNCSAGRYTIAKKGLKMLPFSEGLAIAQRDSDPLGWGFVDRSYNFVLPPKSYEDARCFKDGLAPVAVYPGELRWGYINRSGKWIIAPRFLSAASFSEGLACVSLLSPDNHEVFGFIDKSGNFVIAPQFRFAGSFHNGLARVRR